jgi:hypothetical protein
MRALISYVAVGATLFGVVALSYLVSRAACVAQGDPVLPLIGQLSAADPNDIRTAKDRIIQIGESAIQPLIAFLKDLLRDPHNRYANGTTEKDFIDARERAERIPPSDPSSQAEAARQLSTMLINQRLKGDVCELLGQLRAEQAVKVLIEAMETWPGGDSWENPNAAMDALQKIGSPAVPEIVEAVESAKPRAATPRGEGHPSEFFVTTEAVKNQARASIVLGAIRDARALPVLERLENSTDSGWLRPYLRRAIAQIKQAQR